MKLLVQDIPEEQLRQIEAGMVLRTAPQNGFLAPGESLREVVARDEAALAELGITPEQVADRLDSLRAQAVRVMDLVDRGELDPETWTVPSSRLSPGSTGDHPGYRVEARYVVWDFHWQGGPRCPFFALGHEMCRVGGYSDQIILDTRTNAILGFPALVIHLARVHHFFEGATSYRLDPVWAARFLELKPGVDYRHERAEESIWYSTCQMPHAPGEPPPLRLQPETVEALREPDEIIDLDPAVRLHRRGDLCVLVAAEDRTIPPGRVVDGSLWTDAWVGQGTAIYERERCTYAVLKDPPLDSP